MLLKIYGITWSFIAMAAALIFILGNFTPLTGVVFGFVCFGMIFMGMMNVLPSTVGHQIHTQAEEPEKVSAKKKYGEVFPASAMPAR